MKHLILALSALALIACVPEEGAEPCPYNIEDFIDCGCETYDSHTDCQGTLGPYPARWVEFADEESRNGLLVVADELDTSCSYSDGQWFLVDR